MPCALERARTVIRLGNRMDKAKLKIQQFKQREQAILDAALELLLEQGEDKVTVEQIADKVDIGKGTIYKHFTSKTEIYVRLLSDYENDLKAKLDDAVKLAEAGDYNAPARVYFSHSVEDPIKARLFQRLEEKMIANDEEPEKRANLEHARRDAFDTLNACYAKGIEVGRLKDVPPYFYYLSYWALTQGAVELYYNPYCRSLVSEEQFPDLLKFIKDIGTHIGVDPALSRTK